MARQVLENGVVLPAEYSDDWYDDMTSNLTKLDDVIGSDSEKLSSADVGAAALSNNYNDLDNLPTIPTVNDATLTIQKNGVDVQTFTANASSNVTCNITVPTKTSDLTNDSNFVDTSNSAVASGITSAKVTDYDSHIADTDIHVTTADKTKWNNGVSQAYVFRYSSTALVASSTNSNSLLDNTDNLKVGDKVIDSDGVLFSITAIDTANSTFTIGTALVDLATDSDVVHKSGNETVAGFKEFANIRATNSIKGINLDSTTTDLNNCYSDFASSDGSRAGNIQYYYCNTDSGTANISNLPETRAFFLTSIITKLISSSLYVKQILINSNSKTFVRYCNNSTWSSWVNETDKYVTTDTAQTITETKAFTNTIKSQKEIELTGSRSAYILPEFSASYSGLSLCTYGSSGAVKIGTWKVDDNDNTKHVLNDSLGYLNVSTGSSNSVNIVYLTPRNASKAKLGDSVNKWHEINGLEPSSLSLPSDRSARVDISSYFIYTGNNATNDYSVLANGYIFLKLNNINQITCYSTDSSSITNYAQTYTRPSDGVLYITFPVRKNDNFRTIWNTGSSVSVESAWFIPCQGNV